MPMQVAVIGGGSWGTTVAHLCAKNVPTTLWARRADVAAEVRDEHRNSEYLAGFADPSPPSPVDELTDGGQADSSTANSTNADTPTSGTRTGIGDTPPPQDKSIQPGMSP